MLIITTIMIIVLIMIKKFGKNDDNDKIMIKFKFHLLKFFKTSFI